MKLLISGYYGFANLGDEAVLLAIIQGIKKSQPKASLTILSKNPEQTKAAYRIKAIGRYQFFSIIKNIIQSDVFVSGGGTLLQNSTSNLSLFYYVSLIYLAKLFGKKTVIFAQGFGPLKGAFATGIVASILSSVDLITIRDRASFEHLKTLCPKHQNLHLTADPAFLLEQPSPGEVGVLQNVEGLKKIDQPLLGVVIRNVKGVKSKAFINNLARAIDSIAVKHNLMPVIVSFQPKNDSIIAERLIKELKTKSLSVSTKFTPTQAIALFSKFNFVIGVRLHALIFAAINNVPMIGISYDPKVSALLQTINQPGIRLKHLVDPQILEATINKALENREHAKLLLAEKTKEQIHQAKSNFDLLFKS